MKQVDARTVYKWPMGSTEQDWVVREEPLEIRVEGESVAITMRTPGHDVELATCFLYTEGVIDGADDLHAIEIIKPVESSNIVDCVLAGGVAHHREALTRATRELYTTSSCGLCGKASIDRIQKRVDPIQVSVEYEESLIPNLPAQMRQAQSAFDETGGLHAAALFATDGTLEVLREDIGRHNAVDKVLGYRILADQVPVNDCILVVSSRASFEILQKAAVAGVPVVAAIGAASSLAIDLANELGITLYGFVGAKRFNRYSPSS